MKYNNISMAGVNKKQEKKKKKKTLALEQL